VLAAIRDHHPVVIMVTAFGEVPLAVYALHKGAENFLTKPVDLSHLAVAAERALEKAQLRRLSRWLSDKRGSGRDLVFGSSPGMRELQAQLTLLSASDRTTALILGESGAGKGRVASLLHSQSPRARKAFVEVNCASLRPESLDSELFGVEAGPEPGAVTTPGAFEIADGGTIYLVGTPAFDPSSNTIHVPDLDFDVATRNLLVAGSAWIARDELVTYLRARARVPAADAMNLAREQLESGLNRALSDEVRISGQVIEARVLGVRARRSSLVVQSQAEAVASLYIDTGG
jgi:CheY-like chemotaxis protein